MTVIDTPRQHVERTWPVWASVVLLVFLGLTAAAGGAALLIGGTAMSPPTAWLEALPVVDSWVIPGLVLGIGFGLGSLLTAYGVWARPVTGWLAAIESATGHHWSWLATMAIGLGQVIWIVLEMIYLPELSWLQVVYGPLGLALMALPWTAGMRHHLRLG